VNFKEAAHRPRSHFKNSSLIIVASYCVSPYCDNFRIHNHRYDLQFCYPQIVLVTVSRLKLIETCLVSKFVMIIIPPSGISFPSVYSSMYCFAFVVFLLEREKSIMSFVWEPYMIPNVKMSLVNLTRDSLCSYITEHNETKKKLSRKNFFRTLLESNLRRRAEEKSMCCSLCQARTSAICYNQGCLY